MSASTTYQFIVSINVRALDVDISGQILKDQPTQTSALLEAPLNVTFHQLTQLAKAKLTTLFDSDRGYWAPYLVASPNNNFSISIQLMHKKYMMLANDKEVQQVLAFIKQRLFTDPLVLDCTITKRIVSPFQPIANGENPPSYNSVAKAGQRLSLLQQNRQI